MWKSLCPIYSDRKTLLVNIIVFGYPTNLSDRVPTVTCICIKCRNTQLCPVAISVFTLKEEDRVCSAWARAFSQGDLQVISQLSREVPAYWKDGKMQGSSDKGCASQSSCLSESPVQGITQTNTDVRVVKTPLNSSNATCSPMNVCNHNCACSCKTRT